MPELSLSVKDNGIAVWWGIIKSLRDFRFACLVWYGCLSFSTRLHPEVSVAFKDGQDPKSSPPCITFQDAEGCSLDAECLQHLPGRGLRTSPEFWLHAILNTLARWSVGCLSSWAVRRAGSGICAHSLEARPALAQLCLLSSWQLGFMHCAQSHRERGFDGQSF